MNVRAGPAGGRARGLALLLLVACGESTTPPAEDSTSTPPVCDAGNGGITLPAGFCATVFADVTRPRHMAMSS